MSETAEMTNTASDEDLLASSYRLGDPDFFLEPEFHQLLALLRRDHPVHWCQPWPDRGFWSITRHADIKAFFDQPLLFSSEPAGANITPDLLAPEKLTAEERYEQGFGAIPSSIDPPRHDEVRAVFARYFTGPAVAKLQDKCQRIVDDIVDAAIAKGECDFVTDVAAPLPIRVISDMMGLPEQYWDEVLGYVNGLIAFNDPNTTIGSTPEERWRNGKEGLFRLVRSLIAERRRQPQDDFITTATTANIKGKPLDERDIEWWCYSLIAAGFETSRNVITSGMVALYEHPDQLRRLQENGRLIHSTMEELLRWTTPVPCILRVASRDTVFHGQKIREGDWVQAWMASGNRDEAVFDDPWTFDIARLPNPYLTFGHGVHNCVGRMLAILEARTMIETILRRPEVMELTGPPKRSASMIAMGVSEMPVRFRA